MMDVVVALMYTAVVIISILLIALILVQPSKGGGLGSAFAGIGDSVFGAHTMGHLSKITIVLLCIFFVLTLGLAVIAGHKAKSGSLDNSLLAKEGKSEVKVEKKVEKKAEEATVKKEVKKVEAKAVKSVKEVKKDIKKAAK